MKALIAAKVDEKFCTKLYSQSEKIEKLFANVLSQDIQTQRHDRVEFDILAQVECPVSLLQLCLQEVQKHHTVEFRLDMRHSILSNVDFDDTIEALTVARLDMLTGMQKGQEKFSNKSFSAYNHSHYIIISRPRIPLSWRGSHGKSDHAMWSVAL